MKFLEKFALVIFSIIISVLIIVLALFIFNVIKIESIIYVIKLLTYSQFVTKVSLIVLAILLLLAIKCIFFRTKEHNDGKNGIILENEVGKLILTKESLETLVDSVIREIPGIETIASKTELDQNNNVNVYVTTLMSKDIVIKDVSGKIQEKIINKLKETADLNVNMVNIKVKNVTTKNIKALDTAENNYHEDNDKKFSKVVTDEVVNEISKE